MKKDKKKVIDKKKGVAVGRVGRSRAGPMGCEEGATPSVLIPEGMEGTLVTGK